MKHRFSQRGPIMRILFFFAFLFIAACASEPEPKRNSVMDHLKDDKLRSSIEEMCEEGSDTLKGIRGNTRSDLSPAKCVWIIAYMETKDPRFADLAYEWSNGWVGFPEGQTDQAVDIVQHNNANSASLTQFGLDLANSKSQTLACTFSSEQKSGFNKVCYYKCGLDTHATNVASTQICPLTVRK